MPSQRPLASSFVVIMWCLGPGPGAESQRRQPAPEIVAAGAEGVLREASALASKQDARQRLWTDCVLLRIGAAQIRAHDFDGALLSLKSTDYTDGRNGGLIDLAEAIASAGDRDRAFAVLRQLREHGWRQDYIEDRVQLRWVDHLVAINNLARASQAVDQLNSPRYRADGLRRLAVAHANAGDSQRAAEFFKRALTAAMAAADDSDRFRAVSEVANAQLASGMPAAALITARRLAESSDGEAPWGKICALRDAAVIAAKAKDNATARELFRRAAAAASTVDGLNTRNAIGLIATGRAAAGYIDEALSAASTIPDDFARADALGEIVVAQLRANDVQGAARTVVSDKYPAPYRDNARARIVDFQITKRDLKAALAAAEELDNQSRKAAAKLRIATAYARSGDRTAANEIAGRIELVFRDLLIFRDEPKRRFEFLEPRTWGELYNMGMGSSMRAHHVATERATEVAATAMTLALAMGHKHAKSYAVLFDGITAEEVIQALARAHAAHGDPGEALVWARQIGSDQRADLNDDKAVRAVERRIHALLGVGEGILDRAKRP